MAEPKKKEEQQQEQKNSSGWWANRHEVKKLSLMDTVIVHPVKQVLNPGLGNKVDGALGIAGRGLAGYGIVKGIQALAKMFR